MNTLIFICLQLCTLSSASITVSLFFNVTGEQELITIPEDVFSVRVKLVGASGGGELGGHGGVVEADVIVKPKEIFYVTVGGMGGDSLGGFNGGGEIVSAHSKQSRTGGGSTDIRSDPSARSRIVVAGGGGGGPKVDNFYFISGGSGNGGTVNIFDGADGVCSNQDVSSMPKNGGSKSTGILYKGGLSADQGGGGGSGYYAGLGGAFRCGGGGGSSYCNSTLCSKVKYGINKYAADGYATIAYDIPDTKSPSTMPVKVQPTASPSYKQTPKKPTSKPIPRKTTKPIAKPTLKIRTSFPSKKPLKRENPVKPKNH